MSLPIATLRKKLLGSPSRASNASPPHITYGDPNVQTSLITSLGTFPRMMSMSAMSAASEPPMECPVTCTLARSAPNAFTWSTTACSMRS